MKKFLVVLLLCLAPLAFAGDTDFVNPEPVVIPATQERVYDLLWMRELNILAEDTETIKMKATFLPYRRVDGVGEIQPSDPFFQCTELKKEKTISWAELQTKPKLAAAYQTLIEAIKEELGV